MNYAVVIPARFASERLPGKPILSIVKERTGKDLIQHVYENAVAARGARHVIVATDDERIHKAVTGFGGRAVMTRADHQSGTDRIAEACEQFDDVDVIVNVQGDEPQIRPGQIEQVAALLDDYPAAQMGTLAVPIDSDEELRDPNAVKVVLDAAGYALYFSRSTIPYVRGATDWLGESPVPHLKHLGIYSYRREFLYRFTAMPSAPIEQSERLEQLRAVYNGHRIAVGITDFCPIGIDTREDLDRWLARYREKRQP